MFDWLEYDTNIVKEVLKDNQMQKICICGSDILSTSLKQLLDEKIEGIKEELDGH